MKKYLLRSAFFLLAGFLASSLTGQVLFVTINQASGQADPTSSSPVNFTVVFSEAVTGFTFSDVSLTGSAAATTVVVTEIAPNNGTTYNVAASGMTADGMVIATIPANVVLGAGNIGNTVSSSTDNTVTYILPPAAPTITCPANTSVLVNENCLGSFTIDANTVSFTGSPTPTISYNWTIFEVYEPGIRQGSLSDISQGPITLSGRAGGISIIATATNSAGSASCSFSVALIDNVAPQITCENRTLGIDPDCVIDVTYSFLLSDNCDNASPIVYSSPLFNDGGISNSGFASISRTFSTGIYYDTITVNDFSGNSSTCTYVLTIEDKIVPVFVSTTCENKLVTTGPSATDCGAVAEFFPTARDNCDGLATVTTNIPSGSFFQIGNTPVIATATDHAGNTSQCSFTVTVLDNTPPQMNCPPPQVLYTTEIICVAVLPDYTNYANLAWDNCGVRRIEQSTAPFSGLGVGQHNISLIATDRNDNVASCIVPITVIDNIPPFMICRPGITLIAESGECYADGTKANVEFPSASDNCTQNVMISPRRPDGLNLVANYPAGVTIITWTARDAFGNTATCAQTITVIDDQPPTITNVSASPHILWPPNHKMKDVEIRYTSSDNCGVASCRLEVSSNEPVNGTADGDTDPDWEIIDDHHVMLRAERANNGDGRIYTITIICSDEQGNETRQSTEVRVAHNITAPGSGQSFKVGSTVNFAGTFWDKPGNTHTAKWLIDGASVKAMVTEPSGNKNGKVTGSYKFTTPGVYKLQMNVTDQNGITSFANTNGDLEAIVVVYDPNGGYTYGGGYYNSPSGALVADPSSSGKASYGFAMNYFKNSTNPKGETQFEFKVGDFEFNALNFDYLVISNSMAQFNGTGKIIGGQSGIGFTMTVVDGELDGTGIDKVRMKIYNKNNGKIIYDNQPGASNAALPVHGVGANSTIVIKGNNSSLTKSNTTNENVAMESNGKVPDELDLVVYPNPSSNNFSINVPANTKQRITMQVVDMYGRVIETRNVIANSTIRFGDRYWPGTYVVRIITGNEKKEMKLIKLSE